MPRLRAARRRRGSESASAWGTVRSSPMPAPSMSVAAARPVSSEIWAFHRSTGRSRAQLHGPRAVVAADHHLLGEAQLDGTPLGRRRDQDLADGGEGVQTAGARRRRRRRAGPGPAGRSAGRGCGPGPGARRSRWWRPSASTSMVHSTAGRGPSGSSDAARLAEDRRVERDALVGGVVGLRADVGLGVERRRRGRPTHATSAMA